MHPASARVASINPCKAETMGRDSPCGTDQLTFMRTVVVMVVRNIVPGGTMGLARQFLCSLSATTTGDTNPSILKDLRQELLHAPPNVHVHLRHFGDSRVIVQAMPAA